MYLDILCITVPMFRTAQLGKKKMLKHLHLFTSEINESKHDSSLLNF